MYMKKSKLLGLLKSFDAKELRAFKDFVASPYFNKQKDLMLFYDYLKKIAAKGFPEKKMERMYVFKQVFPERVYTEKDINYLMSQLLKLAEQFIGLRKIEQSEVLTDCYILSSYIDRKLEKQYKHILSRTEVKMKGIKKRDEDFYYQRYLVSDQAEKQFSSKKIRQHDPNLQEAADNLDIFYFTKKLKFLCAMLDRQKHLSKAYQLHLVDEIKAAIHKSTFHEVPSIAIYLTLLETLTEVPSDPHFFKLKDLIFRYGDQFKKNDMQDLYYFSINYCIQKIRIGDKSFATELMGLYQEGIEQEYLLDNGQISPWTFKNMVKLGLGLNRFDWVETFVTDYNIRLPEESRADAYHFNLADLHYHRKDFEKAMHHLNQVEFHDIHYNLGAKVMLLKIYFETEATEAFLSLVSSFKIFLKRNKSLSKNAIMPYTNFLQIVHQIFKYGAARKEQIHEQINTTKMLSDRTWLLQQLTMSNE